MDKRKYNLDEAVLFCLEEDGDSQNLDMSKDDATVSEFHSSVIGVEGDTLVDFNVSRSPASANVGSFRPDSHDDKNVVYSGDSPASIEYDELNLFAPVDVDSICEEASVLVGDIEQLFNESTNSLKPDIRLPMLESTLCLTEAESSLIEEALQVEEELMATQSDVNGSCADLELSNNMLLSESKDASRTEEDAASSKQEDSMPNNPDVIVNCGDI